MLVTALSVSCEAHSRPLITDWCERSGFRYVGDAGGDLQLAVAFSSEPKFTHMEETRARSDEIYELELAGELPGARATIVCSSERGARHALRALERKLRRGEWSPGRELIFPRFPLRGIVEGFYGRPWSREERLDMLAFIASCGMNAYMYAPKDDAYHRQRWRELYDEESLGPLREAFEHASSLGLHFYYCIAPGLSMRYSDEGDYAALLAKAEQMLALGVRRFGLLLDDIPDRLQHPGDRAAFADLATAQAALANRFHSDLRSRDDACRLVVCPTLYCGRGDEPYLCRLGESLHPAIDLFWTGRNICSQELTLAEAAVFTRSANRMPLYWDNYPVNDLEMAHELHIGPYQQRDPRLYRFSRGVIANGMEYAESSKIAFAMIADYLWDPERYDPEASWREAVARVAGSRDAPHFLRFADNVRYSCLYPTDSPALAEELEIFGFDFRHYDRTEALDRLDAFVRELQASAGALRPERADNPKLLTEAGPWLRKFAGGCELLLDGVAYLREPDDGKRQRLGARWEQYRKDPARVFADVLASFLQQILDQGMTP